MINVWETLKLLIATIPFILLVVLSSAVNLKKKYRARQFPMPVLAFIYSIVLVILGNRLNELFLRLVEIIQDFINSTMAWNPPANIAGVGNVLKSVAGWFGDLIDSAAIESVLYVLINIAIIIAHLILKRIIISILKAAIKNESAVLEKVSGIFYEYDFEKDTWYVKKHFGQARKFVKTFYIAIVIISILVTMLSFNMWREDMLSGIYYPVFAIIVVGEIFFFLDGITKNEDKEQLEGEDEDASKVGDYSLLRKALRRLFGDKLAAEDTVINSNVFGVASSDEMLNDYENRENIREEAYGVFMRGKSLEGLTLDTNYLKSGMDLLQGKSILFNTPFYYDLIPYAFYPMNDALVRNKKVLIILGRHDIENDVIEWCREGFSQINSIEDLWNVGVLADTPKKLDVGIITRSDVHNIKLHDYNKDFFENVEFVMLIEPSRLVPTAQVGLNSIIRRCCSDSIVFCSADKNCDGLVDSLSHILLKSICEVSATNRPNGVSSYMCWDTDTEHLQHRLTPNISRYLGVGTELSFVGLKNQVAATEWYGGDAFPVVDIHWIDRQYYYDLLHYANLQTTQDCFEKSFKVSSNMWNARVEDFHYMTVEDESYNMFEVKRNFATRASEQGFVNVISSDYLLKDYMTENDSIFNVDPKAIPYIVADYSHSRRNVIMRLCLMMSSGYVLERNVKNDFALLDIEPENIQDNLWHEICLCYSAIDGIVKDDEGNEVLVKTYNKREVVFNNNTIRIKRKFSLDSGKMENCYYIADEKFIDLFISDMQNANYVSESEDGENSYLGSELKGHIFQKYLPGQFFTFGGKYYEMVSATHKNKVILRRAADHITGRPMYRQVRKYVLNHLKPSDVMAASKDIAGLKITKMFADIHVETPAYWNLSRYNDFASGKLVEVSGIPSRDYCNKQLLKIELPDHYGNCSAETVRTITVLLNEVFRTLFAENQNYIIAVSSDDAKMPDTYSVSPASEKTIYIIEDSQLDIGLVEAVERNLSRILFIISDYLDWHFEELEKSLNPPAEPEVPDYAVGDEEEEPEEKPGIRKFFKKLFGAIAAFFKKLFGRKKKVEEETPTPESIETPVPAEGEGITEPTEGEGITDITDITEPAEAIETDEPEEAVEVPATTDDVDAEEPADAADSSDGDVNNEESGDPIKETPDNTSSEVEENSSYEALLSVAPPVILSSNEVDPGDKSDEENTEKDDDEFSFEPDGAVKISLELKRKPYHERYYLLYGNTEMPEGINIEETREYLRELGFINGELEQARKGKNIADLIEKNFVPNKPGVRYCDFCGSEIIGTEYETLVDGRERCMTCGKTAIKTAEEFEKLYKEVLKYMESFYGVKITVPIKVQMVNSKKLHRQLGKSFVPTGNLDGRTLGVAIKAKNGYSLLLENGAPRLMTIMTMAHEITHIWQYLNWNADKIVKLYGRSHELEIYEGMAKWSEIQFAWLLNEPAAAKREEIITLMRNDEYGRGYKMYISVYPISEGTQLKHGTPFDDVNKPL